MLRRISQKTGVAPPPSAGQASGVSHIDLVRAGLPAELRAHLVTCLLKPAEIVLFAESAAWATRLRVAAVEASQAGAYDAIAGATARITVKITPPLAGRTRGKG